MASKEEDAPESTDSRCPPIKESLINPKSFDIRQFSKDRLSQTYVGLGASETREVTKSQLLYSANRCTSAKWKNESAEEMNNSELENNTQVDLSDNDNNKTEQVITFKEESILNNELLDNRTIPTGQVNKLHAVSSANAITLQTDQPTKNNSNENISRVTNERTDLSNDKTRANTELNVNHEMSSYGKCKENVTQAPMMYSENVNLSKNNSNNTEVIDQKAQNEKQVKTKSVSSDKDELIDEENQKSPIGRCDKTLLGMNASQHLLIDKLDGSSGHHNPEKNDDILTPVSDKQELIHNDSSEKQQEVSSWIQVAQEEPDIYVWKCAFSCDAVLERIKNTFHKYNYDIEFRESLFIKHRKGDQQLNEQEIRKLMDHCIQDLPFKVYTISNEISNDVKANIEHLRMRPKTRMAPENPFIDNTAVVYLTESQNEGYFTLVLVSEKQCFVKCSMEIEGIIHGCLNSPDDPENDRSARYDDDAVMSKCPSHIGKQESNKILFVNCEEWKFRWVVRKEGILNMLESKLQVQLQYDNGKIRIMSENENHLEDVRKFFQKQTLKLAKESKTIRKDFNEHIENSFEFNENLHEFEQKYKVVVDIAKVLDQQEDVQIELDNVSVILTTNHKTETTLIVDVTSSSNGSDLKFQIGDEVVLCKHMKDSVQAMLQKCTEYIMAIRTNRYVGESKQLASILRDFIECLRSSVKKSSEFTLLVVSDSTKQFLWLKKMLERFVRPQANNSSAIHGPTNIQVIKGKLAEQEVGVIVNSSNESLTLTQGAVSRSLLEVSGLDMQTEARKSWPNGIKAGQIAETRGYKLRSAYVFHTCLLSWNAHVKEKQVVCRKVLQDVVRKCLRRTEEFGLQSIAFPALGTGVLKFPNAIAAEDMIKAVQQYSLDNPDTCIQKVLFVIYITEEQLFKVFEDKLKELSQQNNASDFCDEDAEYCAVITGKREDVSIAKAKFDHELLSKFQSEILVSGRRMQILQKKDQTYTQRSPTPDITHPLSERNQFGNALSKTSDNESAPIHDVSQSLTSDKGAIPKTNKATIETGVIFEGSVRHLTEENRSKTTERLDDELHVRKPLKVDTVVDGILDKYLEDVTVTLHEHHSKHLQETDHETLGKRLKMECNVDLDKKYQFVKGTANDISRASESIIYALENKEGHPDLSQTGDEEEVGSSDEEVGSSDDFESETVSIDSAMEQSIFEETLSMRSKDVEMYHLRNIRKEVFMLFKIMYKDIWQDMSNYVKEVFINDMIHLNIGGNTENVSFLKNAVEKLDSFHFIEFDISLNFKQLVETAYRIKKGSRKFDDIHILENGNTVILAGMSFDLIDELRRIVENAINRGNQTLKTKRLIGRQLSGLDEKRDQTNDSLSRHHSDIDERISVPEICVACNIEGCRKFTTNEGVKIYVYRSSILQLEVDCIVNAANSMLEHGGGVAKVIADAAGPSLVKECKEYIKSSGPLPVGTSCVSSAGRLHYKHVIHTVGPCMRDYTRKEADKINEDLYKAIYSALEHLKLLHDRSIGIPSVSTGIFGVPKKWCALQFCLAVKDFSRCNFESSVKEVHFIDIEDEMLQIIGLTCDIVLNDSDEARRSLKLISPKQRSNTKAKVRQLFRLQKNIRNIEEKTTYPCVKSSFHSKLKLCLSKGFQISVKQGNIVDFKKGVIVCGQDPELKCHGAVVKAIQKADRMFHGKNLQSRFKKKSYNVGEVLEYKSRSLGYVIYITILPHGKIDLSTISLCYSQVLEVAGQNGVPTIAVPLLITGNQEHVKQIGRILAGLFIEMVNTKGPYHRFPDVYIYDNNRQNVKLISEALTEIILPPKNEVSPASNLSTRRQKQPLPRQLPDVSKDAEFSGRFAGNETLSASTSSPYQRMNDPLQDLSSENVSSKISGDEQINERNQQSHTVAKDSREVDIEKEDIPHGNLPDRDKSSGLESIKCVICMDNLNEPKTLQKCGHTFCSYCIDEYFKIKPVCPTCFTPYGILTGTQPKGEMRYHNERFNRLPGYEECGVIKIQYSFADGIQGEEHPCPGYPYTGTRRSAYLPDNEQGRNVCKMLEVAFKRKLVFTVGRSVTTGAENIVTWNDIHHKTNIYGGPAKYGFPDPNYLSRVTDELAAKGVTEADIKEV